MVKSSTNPLILMKQCMAYGSTVQAAILPGVKDEIVQDVLLVDVAPLSLVIELGNDKAN